MNDLVQWIIFMVCWWFLNLEYNPTLGNVWLRPNSQGIKKFCYKAVLSFVLIPLQQLFSSDIKWMWHPSWWDANIYMMILFGYFAHKLMYVVSEYIMPLIANELER